jgi:hypothetical protein
MRHAWLLLAAFALAGCNGHADGDASADGPDGARCSAKVLGVADTGETINEDPVARLTLLVRPPTGAAPFGTTIEATVSRLAMPRSGEVVPVVCDPSKPDKTELIEE